MNTFPKRKQIRIKDSDYTTAGAYFVTVCTKDRRSILSNIVGEGSPLPQLTCFGEIADKWVKAIPQKYQGISVDCYVIMPDHIHLLLVIADDGRGDPSPTIETVMGWFKYQVTKEINKLNKSTGQKIFQRSFYDHVIRNEQDYCEISEYIENNPLKITK